MVYYSIMKYSPTAIIEHVRNLRMPQSQNPIVNAFRVETNEGVYFQSYDTVIAFKSWDGEDVTLSNEWDCSVTTIKHLKIFLGYTNNSAKVIRENIAVGNYKLES